MDTIKVIEVIESTVTRRGDGTSMQSPVRIITQYLDKTTGRVLAEVDPCAPSGITPEFKREFIKQLNEVFDGNDVNRAYDAFIRALS